MAAQRQTLGQCLGDSLTNVNHLFHPEGHREPCYEFVS